MARNHLCDVGQTCWAVVEHAAFSLAYQISAFRELPRLEGHFLLAAPIIVSSTGTFLSGATKPTRCNRETKLSATNGVIFYNDPNFSYSDFSFAYEGFEFGYKIDKHGYDTDDSRAKFVKNLHG
jgi:hypothetical protein